MVREGALSLRTDLNSALTLLSLDLIGWDPALRIIKPLEGLGPSLSMEVPFGALGRRGF